MLKNLFTSETRVKLLELFLLHPEEEYFIRELTRKLDEQINSIRRELDNLKKIGLLKSKSKNRKKYYIADKNFIFFAELKNIIVKSMSDNDTITKKIAHCGAVDLLVLSGIFVDKPSSIDLLIVGDLDKDKLSEILNNEIDTRKPVKFSILPKEEFLYRLKCKDKFIKEILTDQTNIIAINNLGINI
ncbi:hypothetical protein HZA39_02405 [Candidatus Peregrinibacteria bacterium]|nr:hypothetical protein [Candidatus Peregrinibacteria bacterium]